MHSDVDNHLRAASTPLVKAIASSGLVDAEVLLHASQHVSNGDTLPPAEHDRRLGERLVDLGAINAWQLRQLQEGRTKFNLGAYRILDSLGVGGMGHVFKGEHELLGRVEAIKVLPRVKSSPAAIASFRHEMRAQATLDHPNLVRVLYADQDGDTYFLVTEFVPGVDLRRLIRRAGPLTPPQAATAVAQAADAIDHAHRRGVVHRDVKPGNLLITPTGVVKVIDLGLAFSFDALLESSSVYDEDKIAGTSDYVAPETIREPGRVRPESDLYGLGCTLYYAVTGKVPYPGGTHAEKLRRRLREDPRDAKKLAPHVPDEMLQLIRRLMARKPEHRPVSAGAVASTLRRFAGEDGQASLARLVTDWTANTKQGDSGPDQWPAIETGELPDTVGGPAQAVLKQPAEVSQTAEQASNTPLWIAAGAVSISLLIALLALFRSLFG